MEINIAQLLNNMNNLISYKVNSLGVYHILL